MSSIIWDGNRLIQKMGGEESELGYIGSDKNRGTYALWLKDHNGTFIGKGSYIRGDTWNTFAEAKEKAADCSSAFLAHLMWVKSLGSRYGFLAMQYDEPDLERLVKDHIKPAISKELGYEVRDLRDVARAGIIDEIMRTTIKGASFVIADLTHDNNGAYWEAGFAEGFSIPVIYICQEEKFRKVKTHFDTNHLTTIRWRFEDPDGFRKELVETIRRTIDEKRRS